jgi:hypothetical protein
LISDLALEPGDYYICVQPWRGATWDHASEGGLVKLTVTRTDDGFGADCARRDSFQRSESGTFGTPSDGGPPWTSNFSAPYGVSSGIATLTAHGPLSGPVDDVEDAVIQPACLDCDASEVYFNFIAQDLSSTPALGFEVSPGQWQIPDRTSSEIEHQQYLQVIYGSRLGHNLVFTVGDDGILYAALGITNLPYFSDPVGIVAFGSALEKTFHVRMRFTPALTSVAVWADGDAEPSPQMSKATTSSAFSVGSVSELGSTVQFQAGAFALSGFTVPTTSISLTHTDSDPLRIGCSKGGCASDVPPSADEPRGATSEEPDRITNYVYRLQTAFTPGTERVWVEGHLLRPGSEYTPDPTAGTITISSTVIDPLTGAGITPEDYDTYTAAPELLI